MQGLANSEIAALLGIATKEQKEAVELRIDECMEKAAKYFPFEYERPTVTFDLKGTTAGMAWDTTIKLNALLLKDFFEEMIEEVLPHEIAHCVVLQKERHVTDRIVKPHGWQWGQVMRIYGLPPKRTHNMPVKNARVHARPHMYGCVCPGKIHALTNRKHRQHSQGAYYVCATCNIRLQYLGSE